MLHDHVPPLDGRILGHPADVDVELAPDDRVQRRAADDKYVAAADVDVVAQLDGDGVTRQGVVRGDT